MDNWYTYAFLERKHKLNNYGISNKYKRDFILGIFISST